MEVAICGCVLFMLMFNPALPMCMPSDFTLFVEKPECNFCVAINTTICMGFCRTKDSIVRSAVGPLLYQRSCTYDKVEYRTDLLPGCIDNAMFTYPVALSCHCGSCRTENHECAHRNKPGLQQLGQSSCTKPIRHVYPYLDQSDYSIPF
ncbi:thyroid stimulating hormone subunit beta a [Eucyclogobius newberryi]|uniref:thyroid stimulating hormone subunit beta a n=1 Tax=Eucyclogobius newberryi TaxID=166745 RepID=UPI003B5B7659